MPPADAAAITLEPITEADFAVLRSLAGAIWRRHYAEIISAAQIEFMLAGRFSDEALQAVVGSPDRWLRLLRFAGTPVGYCGYELAPALDGIDVAAMKLGQLYVHHAHRGEGLGRLMLDHVEARAREHGRNILVLQVNKRNTAAISFYEAVGFSIVRAAVFDIGSGFVMDDYVMEMLL